MNSLQTVNEGAAWQQNSLTLVSQTAPNLSVVQPEVKPIDEETAIAWLCSLEEAEFISFPRKCTKLKILTLRQAVEYGMPASA